MNDLENTNILENIENQDGGAIIDEPINFVQLLDKVKKNPEIETLKKMEPILSDLKDFERSDDGIYVMTQVFLDRLSSEKYDKYILELNKYFLDMKNNKGKYDFEIRNGIFVKKSKTTNEKITISLPKYEKVHEIIKLLDMEITILENKIRATRDTILIKPTESLYSDFEKLKTKYLEHIDKKSIFTEYLIYANNEDKITNLINDHLIKKSDNRNNQRKLLNDIKLLYKDKSVDYEVFKSKIEEYLSYDVNKIDRQIKNLKYKLDNKDIDYVVLTEPEIIRGDMPSESADKPKSKPKPKKKLVKKDKKVGGDRDESLQFIINNIEEPEEIKEEPEIINIEESKEEPVEEPVEEPNEEPVEESKEESKEEPVEESKEESKEELMEEPKEEPKEETKIINIEEPEEKSEEDTEEEPEIKVIKIKEQDTELEGGDKVIEIPDSNELDAEELDISDDEIEGMYTIEDLEDDLNDYTFEKTYDSQDEDKADINIPIDEQIKNITIN